MERYLRFGYLALATGGVILVLGGLLYCATWTTPFSAETVTTGFVLAAVLRLAGIVGLMMGLSAVIVRQSEAMGRTGLVALVGVTAWLVLWAGTVFTDLFIAGALARSAPGVLDGTVPDDRLALGFLVAYFTVLFVIVLGVATLRARVFGRAVGWLLIATGVVAIVPLPVDLPVSDIELGVLLAVVGVLARRAVPLGQVERDGVAGVLERAP